MADAVQTVGEGVQQKAPDELAWVERHDFSPSYSCWA
jgi:hypothetical protein